MPDAVSHRFTKWPGPAPGSDGIVASPCAAPECEAMVDLVCHGAVPLTSAGHRVRWGNDDFYFCSRFCQHRFASDPEAFVPHRDPFDKSTDRDNDHAAA